MVVNIICAKYYDENNLKDKGNNCYFLYFVLEKEDFFNTEISQRFNIDYVAIAKRYGGFVDGKDVFFRREVDAERCKRELENKIKNL